MKILKDIVEGDLFRGVLMILATVTLLQGEIDYTIFALLFGIWNELMILVKRNTKKDI